MSQYNFFGSWIMKTVSLIGILLVGMIHAENEMDLSCQCDVSYLQIGGSYTYVNIETEGLPSFSGNLGGVQGSYEYRPWNGFYGGLKVSWKQGKTENSFVNRGLVYVDAQERIGYTYAPCCSDWSITFFSGLGYRYFGHRFKEEGAPLIKFKYNEFYVPVGFLSDYFFCPCWCIGFNFIWMPQIYPTVEIIPLKGARWVLENALDNMRVELPLTYFFTQDTRYSLVLNPFYEHWEDGHSTAETAAGQNLGLPKNFYNFWGVELNVAFSF